MCEYKFHSSSSSLVELDIAAKNKEIKMLEEEKAAKEEEIDAQNRVILGNTKITIYTFGYELFLFNQKVL